MRIVIATSVAPFVDGGSTYIVESLGSELKARSHDVEILRFPFSEDYAEVLHQLLALRLFDLSQDCDRLITIRTPSHLLKHPNKIAWFIHHYRGAYDLWGTKYQYIPNTPEGMACREAIIAADNVGLREAARVFCNSGVVRDRLRSFNGIEAEVVYPPLLGPHRFYTADGEDFLLYFSRLTHHKRQWLAIEGLRHTRSAVKLVIAGSPDPGVEPYLGDLDRLIDKYGLRRRVTLVPHWVPEHEKLELFARCLAAIYFPLNEDSYGYPSLEAHAARKAVLTTTDAGGTCELIVNGYNGLITPPDPELIGCAMDQLYNDRHATQEMGRAGELRIEELQITWDNVVARLLR